MLESRQVLSVSDLFNSAIPLDLTSHQAQVGLLGESPTFYAFSLVEDGRLIVDVEPRPSGSGVFEDRQPLPDGRGSTRSQPLRVSLLSSDGEVIVQSDGRSPHNRDGLIDLHLAGDSDGITYYLRVEPLNDSVGEFVLTTNFATTTAPFESMPVGVEPWSHTAADLNADGIVDLAVANFDSSDMSIYLGQGDGTFALPTLFGIGSGANFIIASDFNADGRLDLATANMNSSTVSILLGVGDGTFQTVTDYAAGDTSAGLTAADFNRDGTLDLAVAAFGADAVTILLNDGSGVFSEPIEYAVGDEPYLITTGDFNGDGRPDLAAPNYSSDDVSILLGVGDGTFLYGPTLAGGSQPYAPLTSDFNDDGQLDLAVTNFSSNDVSIFLGHGDGTFADQTLLEAGRGATAIDMADFNNDGRLDLITANLSDASLSLLLGRDDGTFEPQRSLAAGTSPSSVSVADFNADGTLDVGFTDLTANFVQVLLGRGNASFQTRPAQSSATKVFEVATADFNGDGRLDLASANYTTNDVLIHLGHQDGTFLIGGRFTIGSDCTAIVSGDINRDGTADLITANYGTADIAVLLGVGDGTFGEPEFFAAGTIPNTLRLADFNQDGLLDVVTVNEGPGQVSILVGDGNGRFAEPVVYVGDAGGIQIAIADLNQDGQLDLAVTNRDDNNVSLLLQVSDGEFMAQVPLVTELSPTGIAAGDFNGDGLVDLAVSNADSNSLSLFLGIGSGQFAAPTTFSTNDQPTVLLTGHFNQDQVLDLASIDRGTNSLTVYAGRGDGTFQTATTVALSGLAYQAVLGDFNGDGLSDIATANERSSVSVLLGQADGGFESPRNSAVSGGPAAIAATDFNSDGHLDLVTVNPTTGAVSVSLGRGEGKSLAPIDIVLAGQPVAVVTDDFNNDGRPDLAVANYLSNSVSVLLGIGDGTFQPPSSWSVGEHPVALVTGDFNHDDIVDLATTDFGTGTVSVLFGQADGTFQEAQQFPVGAGPVALTVSDFNHDGESDLIVANSGSRDLTLLFGAGDSTFRLASTLALSATPGAVATGDFNGDGRWDITVTSAANDTVSILFGREDGTFQSPVEFDVGTAPESLAVGDFNRDGHSDIAAANNNSNDVTVLLGHGDGTFPSQSTFEVGQFPGALIAGDFNNDNRLDLATANGLSEPITVTLGLGDGRFSAPGSSSPTIRSEPLVADWNDDGVLDVVVLRNDGRLLYRAGLAGGAFEAPVVINPAATDAVRDLTIVTLEGAPLLVALNVQSNSVAVYINLDGRFLQLADQLSVAGILPSQILTGDLNGDALDDVVITSAASGKVFVYLQRPEDNVSSRPPSYQIDVGNGISDVVLVDANGDDLPEIVVTDQVSGDVRVLLNSTDSPFESQLRFRAGAGLTSVVESDGSLQVQSRDESVAVVAGLFNDDALPDLAVLNRGANRVEILVGNEDGGFFNPTPTTSLLTGLDPIALVTADFNGDSRADLAVLNQGSNDLSIYLNDGDRGFTEQMTTDSAGRVGRINSGNSSTGLSVGDINGDGQLDLLLGNQQGDVLTLLGNGDGTFRPYQRIDRHVGLAITGLGDDQGPAFALFDQSLDRVIFQSSAGSTFQQGREDGLLAPNAVTFADLNADGLDDLIVSSSGSNEVFVYLGLDGDLFDLGHRFFVGTDPGAITISDLNADGIADLVVANHGSNDVSLLFGQGQGADWALIAGPRLRVGSGPIATAVAEMNGDGIADIVVANHDSSDVFLLAGLGRGFFNDKHPIIARTGAGPVQVFVGHFDNQDHFDVVTVNSETHDLTVISGLGHAGLVGLRTVELSAFDPVAAIAQDFNRDGLSDLIVGHESGQFTLWLGGSNRVQAISAQGIGHVTNISELVLGQVTANSVEVYFTSTGNTMATVATFALNFNIALTASFDSLTSFTPPPVAAFVPFSQFVSADSHTTHVNEPVGQSSLDRTGSLTLLPITIFTTEIFSSEANVTVAEFSSPSGSSLEVIATLVLGFHETSAVASADDEAVTEEMSVVDSRASASARDLLVTGAAETPVQQHLQDRTTQEAAIEILFSSPLDLFDVSPPVTRQANRGQATGGLTSNDIHLRTDRVAERRKPPGFVEFASLQPDGLRRTATKVSAIGLTPPRSPEGRAPQPAPATLLPAESNGVVTVNDRTSNDSRPIALCALVICFASFVPLWRKRRSDFQTRKIPS